MIKIFKCLKFVLLYFTIGFLKTTIGHNVTERITEVVSASSLEDYEFDTRSVKKDQDLTFQSEESSIVPKSTELIANESNNYELDSNVRHRKRETSHEESLNYPSLALKEAKIISDGSAQKKKIVFDEKAREDGMNVTNPKDSPYAVLVMSRTADTRGSQCSGTLVTPTWVITTATCFRKEWIHVIVYAGGNSHKELTNRPEGSQMQTTESVYVHPEFGVNTLYRYDIALVQLYADFNMTDTVNTIELSLGPWVFQEYKECEITAFGNVWSKSEHADDDLRKTHSLEMTDVCECLQKRDETVDWSKLVLCSKPEEDYGICAGDLGGGLICDGKLVAVAMNIITYTDMDTCTVDTERGEKCGLKNTLSLFLQICPYLGWVSSHITDINSTSIHAACYKPELSKHSDGHKKSFDNTIQTSNTLILSCLLVPQVIVLVASSFSK